MGVPLDSREEPRSGKGTNKQEHQKDGDPTVESPNGLSDRPNEKLSSVNEGEGENVGDNKVGMNPNGAHETESDETAITNSLQNDIVEDTISVEDIRVTMDNGDNKLPEKAQGTNSLCGDIKQRKERHETFEENNNPQDSPQGEDHVAVTLEPDTVEIINTIDVDSVLDNNTMNMEEPVNNGDKVDNGNKVAGQSECDVNVIIVNSTGAQNQINSTDEVIESVVVNETTQEEKKVEKKSPRKRKSTANQAPTSRFLVEQVPPQNTKPSHSVPPVSVSSSTVGSESQNYETRIQFEEVHVSTSEAESAPEDIRIEVEPTESEMYMDNDHKDDKDTGVSFEDFSYDDDDDVFSNGFGNPAYSDDDGSLNLNIKSIHRSISRPSMHHFNEKHRPELRRCESNVESANNTEAVITRKDSVVVMKKKMQKKPKLLKYDESIQQWVERHLGHEKPNPQPLRPNDHLRLSCAVLLCCNVIFGAIALIFSCEYQYTIQHTAITLIFSYEYRYRIQHTAIALVFSCEY